MEEESQIFVNVSANEPQSEQVTLLLKQLNSYERAPKGLVKSWLETQQNENSTARIFLDVGRFPAWLAYFLTKNAAETRSHFLGKADCNRLINELENAPIASRRLLAAGVTATIQPEVAKKIDSLYHRRIKPLQDGRMSQRPNKKRRGYAHYHSLSF